MLNSIIFIFIVKTCPILRAPAHGQIECQHDDNNYDIEITNNESLAFPIDTQCQFKCDTGYQLLGSKYRNCLPVSRWDGLKVSCKRNFHLFFFLFFI